MSDLPIFVTVSGYVVPSPKHEAGGPHKAPWRVYFPRRRAQTAILPQKRVFAMLFCTDLSRLIHDAIFPGPSQSLCARAHDLRWASVFWFLWRVTINLLVFWQLDHCARSFHYHRRRK